METAAIIFAIFLPAVWIVRVQIRATELLQKELQRQVQSLSATLSETIATHHKDMKETTNTVVAQTEALALALSRIDSLEELRWLDVHYRLIKQLLTLRLSGVSEETIIKSHMNYEECSLKSLRQGWAYAYNNPGTGKREIVKISPYYVAIEKVCLHELRKRQDETHAMQQSSVWDPDKEPPDVVRRELPVYYENKNGDTVEYPGDIVKHPGEKSEPQNGQP
jgi:hypothetical protein